ncbi:hypothetical protein MMC20_007300 [Loxospora ochrophaea]|nr:hypothetical protein [Loxospora ochrophaea]
MPKSFAKVQKKVFKKKGNAPSLHENSRDSQKLRRASAREDKLMKLSASRAKSRQPHLQRIAFFQAAAPVTNRPILSTEIQSLIQVYLRRDTEELAKLKGERRTGRPSSTKEDLLKHRISMEEREYDAGFWLPDLGSEDNLKLLKKWDGDWTSLNTLKFVRMARSGISRGSTFPPNGLS